MKLRHAAVVLALVLSVTGCTPTSSQEVGVSASQSPNPISTQQEAALSSDVISQADYQAGFEAYRACMADKGYELIDAGLDGILYDYSIPAAAMDSGISDECYEFNWQQVDARWQDQNIDDSETAKIVSACLEKNGVEPAASYEENVALLTQYGIDPGTC